MTDEQKRPEEYPSHFHACPRCREPIECWCEFPEIAFDDTFALCQLCVAKQYNQKIKT